MHNQIRILTNNRQFKVQKSEVFIKTKEVKNLKYFVKNGGLFTETTYHPVYEFFTEKYDDLFWFDVNTDGEKYQKFRDVYDPWNPLASFYKTELTNQTIAVFNTLKGAENWICATWGLTLYRGYMEDKKAKEEIWKET